MIIADLKFKSPVNLNIFSLTIYLYGFYDIKHMGVVSLFDHLILSPFRCII